MSEQERRTLPEGWRWARLGEVCEDDRQILSPSQENLRRPYISLEHIESVTGRILKEPTSPMEDEGRSHTFAFHDGHILYGKLRPYLNKVAVPNFAGRCTTEIIPILPKENVERDFLVWLLRREDTVIGVMREKTGSRMPRADVQVLFNLQIPLPPLPEQRRIAAVLTEHLAAIEQARAALEARLEAARALPAALLRDIFESEEAQRWERRRLGDVASVSGGLQKTPNRAPVAFYRPYLTVRNVQRGKLDLASVEHFEITMSELERYKLIEGDILIVEGNGSRDQIGRNALFNGDIVDCIHQNHLIRVRIDNRILSPAFSSIFLNSNQGKQLMLEKAQSTTGLYTLSVSKIEDLEVPIPSLTEQEKVVNLIMSLSSSTVDAHSAITSQLADLNALPAALLRKAFNGEL